MSETRYTLQEAKDELYRRQCRTGHSWDITERRTIGEGTIAVDLRCDSCGWRADVTLDGPDPSWRADR